MSDYQQTVDRIRAFIGGTDQTRTDEIAELATAYSELCRDANGRLRRCVDFLRRGLRSEAIHLADSQPNLLDVVAALDLTEIDEWEQLCASYDLARPMRMMIEAAQEVNEAYSFHEPMRALLDEHRLLALARAPIATRLEVIRELHEAEPTNTCWAEDQEVFETVRLRELTADIGSAYRNHDISAIDRLSAEISNQKWRVALPADVKALVEKASWTLHNETAIRLLQEMIPSAQAARAAGNFVKAKALLIKWDAIVKADKVQQPKALLDGLGALRKWTTEQESLQLLHTEFGDQCARLRMSLIPNVPEEEIDARYAELKQLGLPIPEDLDHLYGTMKKRFQRDRTMQKFGIYLLVGFAAVVIVGTIIFVVVKSMHGGH